MGYVIIHSPDGTLITASNQYRLDAAVERFIKEHRRSRVKAAKAETARR